MAVDILNRFQVRNAATYSALGQFRLDFNDVVPINQGESYIRWIELALSVTYANASTTGTIPMQQIANVIKSLRCVSGGHEFLNLTERAGECLYKGLWAAQAVQPENPGGTSVTGSGTATVRFKLLIPIGYLPGAADPDDYNVPLAELQSNQAAIEGTWANGATGGEFDGGSGKVTISAASMTATVCMIARGEKRTAAYLTWKLQSLAGREERPTAGNMFLHHLIELPDAPAGITETFVTAAGRTQVDELSFDGVRIIDQVLSDDLISDWNRKAFTAVDRLTAHSLGTTQFLPLYSPHVAMGDGHKAGQKPSSRAHPKLKVAGTDTTPTVLMIMSRLLDGRSEAESAAAIGVENYDPAKSKAKGLSKTAIDPRSPVYRRVPRKLA